MFRIIQGLKEFHPPFTSSGLIKSFCHLITKSSVLHLILHRFAFRPHLIRRKHRPRDILRLHIFRKLFPIFMPTPVRQAHNISLSGIQHCRFRIVMIAECNIESFPQIRCPAKDTGDRKFHRMIRNHILQRRNFQNDRTLEPSFIHVIIRIIGTVEHPFFRSGQIICPFKIQRGQGNIRIIGGTAVNMIIFDLRVPIHNLLHRICFLLCRTDSHKAVLISFHIPPVDSLKSSAQAEQS